MIINASCPKYKWFFKVVAMQGGMEIGSKGAMALTGQTTMLGTEALTGKLIMLYFHTLLFSLNVGEDNPAQDALQISLQNRVHLALCIVHHAGLLSASACCHCAITTWSHCMCRHGLFEHEAAP